MVGIVAHDTDGVGTATDVIVTRIQNGIATIEHAIEGTDATMDIIMVPTFTMVHHASSSEVTTGDAGIIDAAAIMDVSFSADG